VQKNITSRQNAGIKLVWHATTERYNVTALSQSTKLITAKGNCI